MIRHRDISASPVRTAYEAWTVISKLVTDTLERSPSIDAPSARRTLERLTTAGLALIAPGHLDRQPLTLVAEPLRLTIGTVSGELAFRALEYENLNPVPGAANATDWVLYIPCPDPLAPLIDSVVDGLEKVSSESPPSAEVVESASSVKVAFDLDRLKARN